MILKTTTIAGVIILGVILLFNDFDTPTKPVQPENLNTFIEKQSIQNPNIIRVSDSKYYLFSDETDTIYVYEGNGNSHTSPGVPRDGIIFGGREVGSFGLIIRNNDILQNASYYKLIIDGESKTYDYNRDRYVVVQDNRIWNPVPQVTIEFLNTHKKTLLKQTF
ncbi:hypothetical protein [Paenibacillus wenxiniae]|uniref:Uncharacterized protein n=1 Tax=Paenibacillus wenxiniae TaxID=1636843 RepID=A0ABW4RGE9_9BACL